MSYNNNRRKFSSGRNRYDQYSISNNGSNNYPSFGYGGFNNSINNQQSKLSRYVGGDVLSVASHIVGYFPKKSYENKILNQIRHGNDFPSSTFTRGKYKGNSFQGTMNMTDPAKDIVEAIIEDNNLTVPNYIHYK
jgi:hypothetical protein